MTLNSLLPVAFNLITKVISPRPSSTVSNNPYNTCIQHPILPSFHKHKYSTTVLFYNHIKYKWRL